MPSIQSNRFYNNPEIGQAFSNLAAAFAPPSGGDLAGYATAKATKEKADALAQLLANPFDPAADRKATFLGAYNPTQSWQALDMGDATQRYSIDVGARTSRENNAADNARALQQSQMTNTKDVTTSLLAPVAQGETRFVPPSIADMYQVDPTQVGNVAANPGERIVTPDGRVIEGAAKPLTESEWMAQEKARLQQSGALTDQMLIDTVMGDQTPVQAVGPDGKGRFMTPGAAVRAGAQPYEPTADKSLVEGTAVIGGKSVQVFRDPRERAYKTADGRPVPADVQVFERAKPTGTNEQLGMKPTEFTTKNGMFGVRADAANAAMNDLLDSGYTPGAIDYEMSAGIGDKSLPVSVSNSLMSANGRQFFNAADNFTLSIARPDTGAAIGNEERAAFRRIYIPLPGDDAKTVAAKRQAREIAAAALSANSAGAAEQTLRYLETHNVPIPEELRARLDQIRASQSGAAPAPATTNSKPDAPAPAADPISRARQAIANGADRNAVIERLKQHGIDTGDL